LARYREASRRGERAVKKLRRKDCDKIEEFGTFHPLTRIK
jgi:hypothetical protein